MGRSKSGMALVVFTSLIAIRPTSGQSSRGFLEQIGQERPITSFLFLRVVGAERGSYPGSSSLIWEFLFTVLPVVPLVAPGIGLVRNCQVMNGSPLVWQTVAPPR